MDRQVYVTNIAKRRPPNNRNPTSSEIEFYLPWLLEEIRLVDPGIIILAGSIPLQAVLNLSGITKKRGHVFSVERAGRVRQVMPVFHPAYLLRNPAKKAEMKVRTSFFLLPWTRRVEKAAFLTSMLPIVTILTVCTDRE